MPAGETSESSNILVWIEPNISLFHPFSFPLFPFSTSFLFHPIPLPPHHFPSWVCSPWRLKPNASLLRLWLSHLKWTGSNTSIHRVIPWHHPRKLSKYFFYWFSQLDMCWFVFVSFCLTYFLCLHYMLLNLKVKQNVILCR